MILRESEKNDIKWVIRMYRIYENLSINYLSLHILELFVYKSKVRRKSNKISKKKEKERVSENIRAFKRKKNQSTLFGIEIKVEKKISVNKVRIKINYV